MNYELGIRNSGFSLLETIVAIGILTLAFLGPLGVASFALRSATLSENQIIAYNLAEEGLEYMMNRRDSNVFAGQNWLNGFSSCNSVNGCRIDVTNNNIQGCSSTCQKLHRDSSSGLYNYDASDPVTIFERRIFLDNVSGMNDERKIRATVSWQERFGIRSITLESHIFERQ